MKQIRYILLFFLAVFALNCSKDLKEDASLGKKDGTHKVTVLEKTDASDYTYLLVKEEDTKYWIAVRKMEVAPDDVIYFSKKMVMTNFTSTTLKKTFNEILFVEDASKNQVGEESGKMPNPHTQVETPAQQNIKVTKAEGGYTIHEIFGQKDQLANKTVKVRGVVVKVNSDILGKNWVHIQDGTGTGSTFDLTLTTKEVPQVGKTVLAEGKIGLDVDFGAGYKYAVIMQDAVLKVE